jgi:hypothetical protein
MVGVPRLIFTTPIVLVSGVGFDDFGELTFSGSVPVSGSAYLKTSQQYAVTNAGIETLNLTEAFTDPRELFPTVGDQLQAQAITYRATQVRPVIDRDGFHAVDISQLKEVEI